MNKGGCILFLVVITLVTAVVMSVSITVRKINRNNIKTSTISTNIRQEENTGLKPEMLPAEDSVNNNKSDTYNNLSQSQNNVIGNVPAPEQKVQNKYEQKYQIRSSRNVSYNNPVAKSQIQQKMPQDPLFNSIKSCKPYQETLKANYNGINADYKIRIDGWKNGRCILNFEANAGALSGDFLSGFGVEVVDANVFVPKIRCEFTKEQLEYAGDSILEENARNSNPDIRMLKDPNSISFPAFNEMKESDLRLLDILINQKACSITNLNEFNSLIQNMMNTLGF